MKATLLLLFLLTFCYISFAQTTDTLSKSAGAIISENSVIVPAGISTYVEVEMADGKVQSLNLVEAVKDSSKTISIKFGEELFGGHNAFILKITNPFDKTLKYKAFLKRHEDDSFEETDVVPVWPGIFSMEMWPYKIHSIKLNDFTLE